MSELSEWLTAIGTIATAIVAIIVAFLPYIRRWFNRPRFSIEFKNEKPFCRVAHLIRRLAVAGAEVTIPTYWVRLRVWNVGKSVAKACEGKLVRIIDAETKEESKDFDPVVLRWTGASPNPIDINKSEYKYLDILYTRKDDAEHFFITSIDEKARETNLTPERKDYILHIVLYGENIEPLHKSFYLKNHKKYDKIELSSFKETEVESMESQRTRAKQIMKKGFATYLICVIISGIIYMLVVIENAYQNLLKGNADAYTLIVWILFLGSLIFLAVEISPPFRKLLFRMFGADEDRSEPRSNN